MVSPERELELWAASGAMALTGRAAGPPMIGPGCPATATGAALARLGRATWAELGRPLPGVEVLGERAAYAGLERQGPASCGGSTRILPTLDGQVALSLARPTDLDLVAALVEGDVADPWRAAEAWLATATTRDADDRIRLLGLPGGGLGREVADRPAVVQRALGRRTPRRAPLVVDLSTLWAGPLCTHLLTSLGARVVTVESRRRPDGTRAGAPGFFRLLHDGQRRLPLDLAHDVGELRELMARADLVVVSARARVFDQWGISAEDVVAAGTSWLSITAQGRASDAVGFGDDVAARAGHMIVDSGQVLPVGDALADPLTGVVAAAAAAEALDSEKAMLLDVSMFHVSREALGRAPLWLEQPAVRQRQDGSWSVETTLGEIGVRRPRRRA